MTFRPFLLSLLFVALLPGFARAETLVEALSTAYENNPELRAARAGLRAIDEGVAQAASGFRPNVSAQASIDKNWTNSFFAGNTTLTQKTYGVQDTQNIFRGFQSVNGIKQAKANVNAERQRLVDAEQQIMVGGVSVYMNVIRDLAVLSLRESNVQVLTRQLQATRDRFEVGEITRTDVAQSEARLSGAKSGMIEAEAGLTASRVAYQRVIGNMPGTLEEPPALPPLPNAEEEAIALAMQNNPTLRAAYADERAAHHAISVAKGELLPSVDFIAAYNKNIDTFIAGVDTSSKTIGVRATVPLYQGGAVASRIREAKHRAAQARLMISVSERQIEEIVRNAWENLRATRAIIAANQAQVRASEIALEGVRQEAEVGSRTTLDVLDAEQELLDARVELVRAERNEYVAGFELLAAIGQATAQTLDLPVNLYDPDDNYDSVKFKFFGWGTKGE